MLGGNHVIDWYPIQQGVEILLVSLHHRNHDKLQPDGTLACMQTEPYVMFISFNMWLFVLFAGSVFNTPSFSYLQEGFTCLTYINYLWTYF